MATQDEKRWMMEKELEGSDGSPTRAYKREGSPTRPQSSSPPSAARASPLGAVEDPPASRGMVIFSVLFYLVAALVMVSYLYPSRRELGLDQSSPQIMANKWVLNSVQVPLFFLLVQLVIAVVLLHVAAFFGKLEPYLQSRS